MPEDGPVTVITFPQPFDPPLAVRIMFDLLAGGVRDTGSLRAVLTGAGE